MMIMRLTGRHGGLQLAKMAARRRALWPDRATAKKAYAGRGAFTTWQDGFLDAYLDGGLLPHDDGLRLACAPHWEAANFQGPQLNCNRHIRRLTVPFTLLMAEQGSTTRARAAFHALQQDKKITVIDGSTHFLPMEMPDLVRVNQSAFALPHDNSGHLALYHWQNKVSDRPVLHWAHANGFNGHTYRPLLTPLADKFDIYAWDARHNDRIGKHKTGDQIRPRGSGKNRGKAAHGMAAQPDFTPVLIGQMLD